MIDPVSTGEFTRLAKETLHRLFLYRLALGGSLTALAWCHGSQVLTLAGSIAVGWIVVRRMLDRRQP